MHDMESYCRMDSNVFQEIRKVIGDQNKGIEYLIRNEGIPLTVMNKVVIAMAQNNNGGSSTSGVGKYCRERCGRNTAARCTGCGHIY